MLGTVQIRQVGYTDPVASALVAELQADLATRYGGPDDTPLDAGVFDPPHGAFFLGYLGEQPVTMGGWRFRPDVSRLGGQRTAEIKRMYVAPSGRRQGLARVVLAHLERTAAAAGADVLVLETGTAQPEAIALYVSAGYERVDPFGHYAWSPRNRCFGKRLVS